MSKFFAAYVEAALWSSVDDNGEPLDRNYSEADLDPLTRQKMVTDCLDFRESAMEMIVEAGLSEEQTGHDFWLTRNGHGAGFWDRGLGQVGEDLSKHSKTYGSFDLIVGDDGKIHGN